MPPAKVVRLAKWVRFGAACETTAAAMSSSPLKPSTRWHDEQLARNAAAPRETGSSGFSGGALCGTICSSIQFWKSASSIAMVCIRIFACDRPQNSVH